MINLFQRLFGTTSVNYRELVANGAIILDVRLPGEFESGHIQASRNIPLEYIQRKVNELKKLNRPIITVCRSGARSGIAAGILKTAGLEAYNGGPWNSLQSKIT